MTFRMGGGAPGGPACRDGHDLIAPWPVRMLQQIDHLDVISPLQVLFADLLEIREGLCQRWRMPGHVEPRLPNSSARLSHSPVFRIPDRFRPKSPLADSGPLPFCAGGDPEPDQHPLGVGKVADDLLDRLGKLAHQRGEPGSGRRWPAAGSSAGRSPRCGTCPPRCSSQSFLRLAKAATDLGVWPATYSRSSHSRPQPARAVGSFLDLRRLSLASSFARRAPGPRAIVVCFPLRAIALRSSCNWPSLACLRAPIICSMPCVLGLKLAPAKRRSGPPRPLRLRSSSRCLRSASTPACEHLCRLLPGLLGEPGRAGQHPCRAQRRRPAGRCRGRSAGTRGSGWNGPCRGI